MSDVTIIAGRSPVASAAIVTADQVTIFGDGTTADPLRAASVPTTFEASFIPDLPTTPLLGMVLVVTNDAPTAGVSATAKPASAAAAANAQAVGVVTRITVLDVGPPTVLLQCSGLVTLSEATWDDVTDGSGGLVPEDVYYVSSTTIGHLVTTAPTASNTFVSQVGIALNPTTMILSTPAFPRKNP